MPTGGFEMPQHILGHREGHTPMQGYACQGNTWKDLHLSHLTDPESLSKEETKAKAELQYQVVQSIPKHIHIQTPLAKAGILTVQNI